MFYYKIGIKTNSLFLLLNLFFHRGFGITLKDTYPVNFFESMAHSKYFNKERAMVDPLWQFVARLYDQGISHKFNKEGQPKIPYKFHLIWLGSTPPERYYVLERKLRELHPGCEIKLWTDHDAKELTMVNRNAYESTTNFGEKSDILRYEILDQEGGVYLDGDFLIVRPLTNIFYAANFFAGITYNPHSLELNNAFIGSEAGHPIIKYCIQDLGKDQTRKDPEATFDRTGPYHFTRSFLKGAVQAQGIVIPFPITFFYAWPNYAIHENTPASQWIQPSSIAMHLWASSWIR